MDHSSTLSRLQYSPDLRSVQTTAQLKLVPSPSRTTLKSTLDHSSVQIKVQLSLQCYTDYSYPLESRTQSTPDHSFVKTAVLPRSLFCSGHTSAQIILRSRLQYCPGQATPQLVWTTDHSAVQTTAYFIAKPAVKTRTEYPGYTPVQKTVRLRFQFCPDHSPIQTRVIFSSNYSPVHATTQSLQQPSTEHRQQQWRTETKVHRGEIKICRPISNVSTTLNTPNFREL